MKTFVVAFGIGMIISALYMLFKNLNTYKQRMKINNALHDYHVYCINNNIYGQQVDYDDEETYEATLFRLFDWSCKNILSKEKYEIIKNYIK